MAREATKHLGNAKYKFKSHNNIRDFPDGPGVKNLSSSAEGVGFDS